MEQLQQSAQALGISLTDTELQQFSKYYNELILWNEHTNITAITDKQDVIIKHFLDSLTVLPYIPLHASKLVDIGSGAGFPGVPIKILRPELEIVLVDTVAKKISFLEHAISTLNLSKIKATHGRAEDLGHDLNMRETFDVATGRAVAHLSILAEYALPLLTVGGVLICQKTQSDEELMEAEQALAELGGKLKIQTPVTIPELENRSIIVIEKISKTPAKYPRKAGIPSKRPL